MPCLHAIFSIVHMFDVYKLFYQISINKYKNNSMMSKKEYI